MTFEAASEAGVPAIVPGAPERKLNRRSWVQDLLFQVLERGAPLGVSFLLIVLGL